MNQRIKELLEQVGGYGTQALMHPDDVEKFAELLIRECLVQIVDAIPDTNCSAADAYKTAKLAATSRVKEHFGVE